MQSEQIEKAVRRRGVKARSTVSDIGSLCANVLDTGGAYRKATLEHRTAESELTGLESAYGEARSRLFEAVIKEYRRQLEARKIAWNRGLGDDELLFSFTEDLGHEITNGDEGWLFDALRGAHLRGRTAHKLKREIRHVVQIQKSYFDAHSDGRGYFEL
jgi:hypothetical protein